MTSFALTGGDTITINLRPLTDLADDDISTVSFPNEIVSVNTGKNRNTVYALNETGNNAEVALRIIMNSSDDKFLNGLLAAQQRDLPAFTLLTGSFIKRVGLPGTGRSGRRRAHTSESPCRRRGPSRGSSWGRLSRWSRGRRSPSS